MKNCKGFTLIEMMIVVTIVAILVALAMPAYRDYVRQARRSDGMDALLQIQNLQERYRANNTSYGSLVEIAAGNTSLEGYYTVAIVGTPNATSYTVTATGVGDQASDAESGTTCTLQIAVSATSPRGAKTPDACW